MTIYRIPADKVVIEDDRRETQRGFISGWLKRDGECESIVEERKSSHNYSQPHKIIYVPVWPPPHGDTQAIEKFPDGLGSWVSRSGYDGGILDRWVAPHPDDTLILKKWRCPSCGYTLEDEHIHWDHHLCKEHDSGPQFNVVKTLGVDEKMMSPDPVADGMWHWVLLVN